MNSNLKAMIEGAITAAIFILLLLLLLYTPLGLFSFVLIPVPFTVYAARNPWRYTILVGILSILITIPFGLIWALPFVIYACLVGFALGISFAKKHSAIQTGMIGFIASLLFFLLALLISSMIFNVNLIDEMIQISKELFTQSEQLIGPSVKDTLPADFMDTFTKQLQDRITAMIVIYSFILGFINYFIGYGLLKRLGFKVTPFPPFSELRFPRSLLFYYLIAMVMALIPGIIQTASIRIIVVNLLTVLEMVLAIQGILFLFYFAKQKNIGKWLPILSIVLLFMPLFQYILRLLGIFDLGLNLRQKLSSRS